MLLSITLAHKADRHLSLIGYSTSCIYMPIFLQFLLLLSYFFPFPILNFSDDSMLGSWPSYDPHNFSQFKPNDPANPSKMTPVTYRPTHERALPPPDQVIAPEAKNILLRCFYQHAEEKLRTKRASSEYPTPQRASKLHRASSSNNNV